MSTSLPYKKILIVKIGAIGDVVMALAALSTFKKNSPHTHITWVCGSAVAPLLKKSTLVDIIVAVNESSLLKGSPWRKSSSLFSIWRAIACRSYDLCITAHSDVRYKIISFCARAEERRSFGTFNGHKKPIPGRFHASEYLSLFTGDEGPHAQPVTFPTFDIPLSERLSSLVRSHDRPLIALAPGGAQNILADDYQRRWPAERYAMLAERLSLHGFTVLIIGSKSDKKLSPFFKDSGVIDLIGHTDILDLVALFSHCDLVITHDSGPFHIARITKNCDIIGLFGPTDPREKTSRDNRVSIIYGGNSLTCRPCYDGKQFTSCPSHMCMNDISVDRVEASALNIVAQRRDRKNKA